jgi:antirestriction protein ArdC
MNPHTDLYATITQRIIAALEAGTPPWVCPWSAGQGSAAPANLSTGRPYRGINTLLLNLQAMSLGYPTNRWLTFQQARSIGAHIRRGESGTGIVFFKLLEADDSTRPVRAANDEPARRVIPLLRSFTVFNQAQVEGLPPALTAIPQVDSSWSPVEAAENVLKRAGAEIHHGGDSAWYSPARDQIQLPPPAQFAEASRYYNVALHELTHWTGHASRCNRTLTSRQHIEAYAFEELVAEMGSAFLSSHCGLPGELHHASYIGNWLAALRNDKRLIFSAASLAQKAADFLLPAPAQANAMDQEVAQ